MITSLSIKNYALIEDIKLDLFSGLTTITGETGAGKSIILGALGLMLGKRADLSSVKDAAKKCVVEAQFNIENYGLHAVFEENELDYEPQTIIRREILPGGKSRAFVNDSPVSLNQLQELSPYLVDVHSQNETLELGREEFQMKVLDALAGNSAVLPNYVLQLQQYKEIENKLESLKLEKIAAIKEFDYNSFLLNELQLAALKSTNQQVLEETFETLNNSELIEESFLKMLQLLAEEHVGALETLKEARSTVLKIKNFAAPYEDIWSRINSSIIELEDIYGTAQNLAEKLDADPELLLQTNERLQTLYKLQQKHNVTTIEELLDIESVLEEKVNTTLSLDSEIKKIESELQNAIEKLEAKAQIISENRKKAIPVLILKIEDYLHNLGLPNARFQFELTPSTIFRKNGMDVLEVLFTANKGSSFGTLKKVASGGEMSRIMLAIKAVLSEYEKLPTIVFDEIDTGVSGEIANKMATIMQDMGKAMQVISITHLPQIASKGKNHYKVYKQDGIDSTQTHIQILDDKERLVEIAHMLAGAKLSDAALANAKELLN